METLISGKYLIEKLIDQGSFGEIYECSNQQTQQKFAIKIEKLSSPDRLLVYESRILRILEGPLFIPKVYYSGKDNQNSYMVTDLLGPSLEQIFRKNSGKFPETLLINTTVQLLNIFEYIHSFGYIHRDIKPENFLFGSNERANDLFVIDFAFAKKFRKSKNEHIKLKEGKKMIGTARFVSISTHLGYCQSRRDDLEALCYMVVYLGSGNLPWMHIRTASSYHQYQKILELKQKYDVSEICHGLHEGFERMLRYCRGLGFEEDPDYTMLKGFFLN